MAKHRSSDYCKQLEIAESMGCTIRKNNDKYTILAPDGVTMYMGHQGEAGVCKLKSFNRKIEKMIKQ